MTTFGGLLRERRQQAGLGLRTFAGLVDERASTVSAIESGRREPWRREETLQRVAEVLGATEAESLRQKTRSKSVSAQEISAGNRLLWWWTTDEGSQVDRDTAAELSNFVGAEPILHDFAKPRQREITWPSLTELAIEWRVRRLLGRRSAQVTAAPVDVEAALEKAGVRLEIVPGLVPRFSIQACAVRTIAGAVLYVDRIVADSRPLASYRHLLALCYAPAALTESAVQDLTNVSWFLDLRQSDFWPLAMRDCQRFALAMLLPADLVLGAAEAAYQELVQQQGWVDVEPAARAVRNRLAEQFAVPTTLVHRRLVSWPCHVYGRVAQALAAEEMTLPPTDWTEHEKQRVSQRELFAKR